MDALAGFGAAPVEHRFYGGRVSLYYDDAAHAYYRYEGDKEVLIPGVTSVVHIMDKSGPLTQWAANLACDYVREELHKAGENGDPLDPDTILGWLDKAKYAHRDYKDAAADTGKIAHAWLEDYIRALVRKDWSAVWEQTANLPEDPRAASGVTAALDWMVRHKVRWLLTERKIYSQKYDYAGTMDGLAYVSSCGDPECCGQWVKVGDRWLRMAVCFVDALAVCDWKTSRSIDYHEYDFQTAAYWQAIEEEIGVYSADPELTEEIEYRFVTRLDKDDAHFESKLLTPETLRNDWLAFKQCLQLYRTVTAKSDVDKLRKREIRQQARTDREEAEAAEKERRAAERQRKRDIREFKDARYRELRQQKVPVIEAKAQVEREAEEKYGAEPPEVQESNPDAGRVVCAA